MIDFTTEALRYAEIGWRFFPLAAGSKLPAIKGGHGVKDASAYPDDIRAWGRLYPHANIGIACGPVSGIAVVDVYPRNGGNASLAALAAMGRVLPIGPRARTGNGGAHHICRVDPRVTNSEGRLGPGIDIKSAGGYIVVAPSWTAPSKDGTGGTYRWEISPFDTPIPRLPIWLTAILAPIKPPRERFDRDGASPADVEGLASWVSRSTEGERSDRLHWAACRAGEMAKSRRVSASVAGSRLVKAVEAAGLTSREAARTVDSGFQKSGLRYVP